MRKTTVLLKNFYSYQKERFPIVVLALSFLPAILSSSAVTAVQLSPVFVLVALLVSVSYLLHVRIIDEFRDYEHDLKHHKDRPVPSGVISLEDLRIVDLIVVTVVLLVPIFVSFEAFLIAIVMLLYSYFARKEFFLGLQFRKHFYFYNAINLVQMLLLQILVYTFANPTFSFTSLVTVHFLFTATGTVIFEFLRKVKNPGDDGTGKDTYTWFLGFNNALILYAIFMVINIALFVKAILLVQAEILWAPLVGILAVGSFTTLSIHMMKKKQITNQLMQLSFMVMYGCFNVLLFFAV